MRRLTHNNQAGPELPKSPVIFRQPWRTGISWPMRFGEPSAPLPLTCNIAVVIVLSNLSSNIPPHCLSDN